MSATTRAVRGNLTRAGYGFKSADGKKDKNTGAEIDRRQKWDKRFFILSDVKPPGLYWYKNESVRFLQRWHFSEFVARIQANPRVAAAQAFMADKEPKGNIPLDMANVDIEDGTDKFEGQTLLTVSSPDRVLTMRFMNRVGFESEGSEWYSEIELRCATGDVISNAVKIQSRFRSRPEEKRLGEAKGAVSKIAAIHRGRALRAELAKQAVPTRVARIVGSMDLDDSGRVDIQELASFFETLQLIDGSSKGKPPKLQAEELIDQLSDEEEATSCSTTDLYDFLVRQFTKTTANLEKIENSMLLIPIGQRVKVSSDRYGADFKNHTGVLKSYYNESLWCYVLMDDVPVGEEEQILKPFKTEFIEAIE